MSDVKIEAKESGSYRIRGPITIVDADGNEYDLSKKVFREGDDQFIALCRCGGSNNKPFCDGTHKRNGFTAPERATTDTEKGGAKLSW